MRRTAWFWISTQLFLLTVLSQETAAARPQNEVSLRRFVCNTGYTLQKCHKDVAVLRRALAKYPVAHLGNWTWILVRSEDWKAILLPRDSPAFTFYPKSETFIEEALVTEVPGRRRELLLKWQMNIGDLLDLAIAHELGHALCNEKDEAEANRVAKMLRAGNYPSCEVNLEAKTHRGKIRESR